MSIREVRSIRRSFAVASLALAAGAFALTGCASASDDGAGGTWSATGAGEPTLTLSDDGQVTGTDGCNQVVGSWEQSGSDVTFSEMATTLMACDGIDGWPGLATGHISGTAMTLKDEAGAELGVLTRE